MAGACGTTGGVTQLQASWPVVHAVSEIAWPQPLAQQRLRPLATAQ